MKPWAVVTDAEQRSAIAACRSLARAGYEVTAAGSESFAVAQWSRAATRALRVPLANEDAGGFVEAIARDLDGKTNAAVVPCGDAAVEALSDARDLLEPDVRLGLPARAAVERTLSKLALLDAAAGAGLACPESLVVDDDESMMDAAGELGFPVVVKPAISQVQGNGGNRRMPSAIAMDGEQLVRIARAAGRPFLLQQHVASPTIVSFAGVLGEGKLLAFATSRYLRTWPPAAGAASCSESIDPIPGLAERVEALLAILGWQGIFELELLDRGGGQFAALDLNPRIYGSVALAIESGVDLPAVWCDWLLDRPGRRSMWTSGRRYRWEEGEIRNAVTLLRRGRLRAVLAIVRPYRRAVHPHFQLRDPGPFLAWVLGLLRRALRRLW